MKRIIWICVFAGACGTTNLKLEPVKVEPIHMTIDVNVHAGSDAAQSKKPASP